MYWYFLKAIQVHTLIWLYQSRRGLWKDPVSGMSNFAALLPSMVSIRAMGFRCTVFATATHPVLWCFETDPSFFSPPSSGIATIGHPSQVPAVTAHRVVLMTGLISPHTLPKDFPESLWSCGWFTPWANKTLCVLPCKKKKKKKKS